MRLGKRLVPQSLQSYASFHCKATSVSQGSCRSDRCFLAACCPFCHTCTGCGWSLHAGYGRSSGNIGAAVVLTSVQFTTFICKNMMPFAVYRHCLSSVLCKSCPGSWHGRGWYRSCFCNGGSGSCALPPLLQDWSASPQYTICSIVPKSRHPTGCCHGYHPIQGPYASFACCAGWPPHFSCNDGSTSYNLVVLCVNNVADDGWEVS